MKRKLPLKRIVAIALLACIVAVSLFSAVFVFTHANHAHDHLGLGGECATCAQIQAVEGLLLQFSIAAGGGSITLIILFFATIALYFAISLFKFQTPVNLKTRMNY